MSLAAWPTAEQPREKLMASGADALSDTELLVILIHSGIRGRSALQISRELLQKFGGLGGLMAVDRQTLCAEPGLGPARIARLKAAQELA